MGLNESLTGLMDQARSVCGEQLEGTLALELACWTVKDRRMHFACAAIDRVDPDTELELAFGYGPSAELAIARCSAQLEVRRWGFLPGRLRTV